MVQKEKQLDFQGIVLVIYVLDVVTGCGRKMSVERAIVGDTDLGKKRFLFLGECASNIFPLQI